MTLVEDIVSDAPEFRRAVQQRQAYQPVYVKIKLMFGCNLKCEMCNHWRETREPPLSIDRFRSVLAELGCRKIHFSGGEPLLRPQVPDLIALATQLGMRVTQSERAVVGHPDRRGACQPTGPRRGDPFSRRHAGSCR